MTVLEEPERRFPHRVNRDETVDSICPFCFVTIGTASVEADLAQMEAAHVCEPARRRHYGEISEVVMGTRKKPGNN